MKLSKNNTNNPFIVILGIAQDGGVPHAGCKKRCCKDAWKKLSKRKFATSVAIVDPKTNQRWIIDATPDFKDQLMLIDQTFPVENSGADIDGVFLTHGHAGHFTGLLQLGKEILDAKGVPVFAMPKMQKFITQNKPWKNLVERGNIKIRDLRNGQKVVLSNRISILPVLVPHRDEHTETVGFIINGPSKRVLFIPDIDKWELLDENIETKIAEADFAFLDGTFFDQKELPHRDISEIPHPFIKDSMKRFRRLPLKEKKKIFFIHLNHTNPALTAKSIARKSIIGEGFRLAFDGMQITI